MRTTGRQAKQKRKKQRSYMVDIEPTGFTVNASSRAEAIKEVKELIFKNGLVIFLNFGEAGVEWDLVEDLSRLFGGGRN